MVSAPRRDLTICSLEIEDAAALAALFRAQPPRYMRFFYPFGFDEEAIAKILAERDRDVYSGIFMESELVGFFMLRGWDAGFDVPSFGGMIDFKLKGRGWLQLTLDIAKLISRLRGAPRLMVKFHPDNISARGARRFGLIQTGVEAESGNLIYHYEL